MAEGQRTNRLFGDSPRRMSLRLGASSNLEPRRRVSHKSYQKQRILFKTPRVRFSGYHTRYLQGPHSRIHPYRHDFENETSPCHVISPEPITMAIVGEGHNGKDVYHLGMVGWRTHGSRHAYSLFVPGATVSKVLKVYAINSKDPTSNDVPTSRRKRFL